ncbi:MAG TPA: hypothetical protein VFP56_12970 [Candidatus Limnocylindrales bacterium]|nr:hypothetical protein [Candidatus Limnocylindrales bacterium]
MAVALASAFALAALAGACSPSPTAAPSGAPASPTPAATTAAASPTAAVVATPQGSLDRIASWRADIDSIIPGLERIHPNPFHGTSKAAMEAAAAELSAGAANLSDDELMVGIARIAALVSANGCDGHTGLYVWGTGSYPVESLPLRLWLFGDDVVIVNARDHPELVGAKIESIEGRPIDDVRAALDPLIPRDNAQTVRLLTPRFLLIPQVLRGIGLANDSSVRFRYTAAGVSREVDLASIPMVDYNSWAGAYGLHLPLPPTHPDVRYLSRVDEALWWEMLPDGATLYVQYNRVESPGSGLTDLRDALAAPEVARVVLDLRNNFGGEVSPLDAMVDLFDDPAVDQPGQLFVVTGRNTFSSASMLAARLEAETDAQFLGEPMGGCPTFYGDVEELPLPNSGLTVLVSATHEVGVAADDTRQTIPLDAVAEITQEEWAAGEDPALDLLRIAAP